MSKLLDHIMSMEQKDVIKPETLAHLTVVTGELIACDPLVPHTESFSRTISPGVYPVVAWWLQEEQAIAAVELRLSETRPVRWEMATRPGQDIGDLEDGYIFGYPVDTGLGCFADAKAIAQMEELEERLARELGDQFISFYDNKVEFILEENDDNWGDLVLNTEEGLNVVMFRSGFGDGYYASYWGFSAGGEVVSLVTDFGLFPVL
ncbi:DUF4241 domain-containing protein [Paenibacillus vini]|uniref:Cytoplasmic protein n=1 Tax=Paenibacillus vini TaxID=1476024 RepID=A0ABQ4MJ36_9BACL|nr:DUF4241 domain-containing protein [Paenibacillus vini]GIP56003.1 hypothetical protein J42TS3_50380 [Paenibacillus vini]